MAIDDQLSINENISTMNNFMGSEIADAELHRISDNSTRSSEDKNEQIVKEMYHQKNAQI